MAIKKILITGSEGYIGSVLVKDLIDRRYQVVGLDALFFSNKSLYSPSPFYHLIRKDIREIGIQDLNGIDAIIHLSALSNDPLSKINPKLTEEINYKATVNLAKKAKQQKVKRFFFASSCSVYGKVQKNTVNENSSITPLTPYSLSKALSEKKLQQLADENFCVSILRFATVYGYSQNFRNDLVVNNLLTCALALSEIKVLSDGSPWRPLIDVRDLSRIIIEFLNHNTSEINGQIFNIGFDENNFQVKTIALSIKKQLPNCHVSFAKEKSQDERSYRVSFAKFKKLFPYLTQKWPLERSIKDMITKLKANKFKKNDFIRGKYSRIVTLKKNVKAGKLTKNLYRS